MAERKRIRLRLCPFCGGEPGMVNAPDNLGKGIPCYAVYCKKCNVMVGRIDHVTSSTEFYRTPEEAAIAWNNRLVY